MLKCWPLNGLCFQLSHCPIIRTSNEIRSFGCIILLSVLVGNNFMVRHMYWCATSGPVVMVIWGVHNRTHQLPLVSCRDLGSFVTFITWLYSDYLGGLALEGYAFLHIHCNCTHAHINFVQCAVVHGSQTGTCTCTCMCYMYMYMEFVVWLHVCVVTTVSHTYETCYVCILP